MMVHKYKGYEITRGSYRGTTDDRIDRWYIAREDSNVVDRRGAGYYTLADAKAAIDEYSRGEVDAR